MTNILTNSAALKSLYHLQRNEGRATEATERLASGKRLNKAGDDAAGAAIVNRMTSQINGMEVAIRNAGDAISMAQTAEGALNEVSEILQRMRELGVQAANGTYSGADRVALNEEIGALKKELIRISEATQRMSTEPEWANRWTAKAYNHAYIYAVTKCLIDFIDSLNPDIKFSGNIPYWVDKRLSLIHI